MTTPTEHSNNHIRECYQFYRLNVPFHPGGLVKIYTNHDHKTLYAIGKITGVYWSRHEEWIVCAEIMEDIGLCIGEFSAAQCVRHVGFVLEVVE